VYQGAALAVVEAGDRLMAAPVLLKRLFLDLLRR